MEKVQAGNTTGLFKIELNEQGDYITVPIGDDAFFDCFARGCKQIAGMTKGACNKLKKIERKFKKLKGFEADIKEIEERTKVNIQFSKNVTAIIDNIFGEGTVKKYFRKLYEEDPDFMPDVECFTDFLDQITPVMQKLSNDRYL